MTSWELKHKANLQKWAAEVQDCRSSDLSVAQWCRERGITKTTYYRWERELLGTAKPMPTVTFAQLPEPKQVCRNNAGSSATLYIGNGRIEFHQELDNTLLKTLVELMQSC